MIKVTEYLQAENSEVKVIDVHPGTVESDMSTVAAAKYGISFTFDDCKCRLLYDREHLMELTTDRCWQTICRDISWSG